MQNSCWSEDRLTVQEMPFEKVDLNKGHGKNKNKREYRHAITLLELILGLSLTVLIDLSTRLE